MRYWIFLSLFLIHKTAIPSSQVIEFRMDAKRIETIPVALNVVTFIEIPGCFITDIAFSDGKLFKIIEDPSAPRKAKNNLRITSITNAIGAETLLILECHQKGRVMANIVNTTKEEAARAVVYLTQEGYDQHVESIRDAALKKAKEECEKNTALLSQEKDSQLEEFKENIHKEIWKSIVDDFARNMHINDDEEFGRGPKGSGEYFIRARVFQQMILGSHALLRFDIQNRTSNEFIVHDIDLEMGKNPPQPVNMISFSLNKRIEPGMTATGSILFDMTDERDEFKLTLVGQHGVKIVVEGIQF